MASRIVCMFSLSLCFLHAAFGTFTSTICTTNATTSVSATAVTIQSLEECAASQMPTAPYLRCSRTLTSKVHAGTAVVTSSFSCSATSPADLPIFIDAARGKASASASAAAAGTCHGATDMTGLPAAARLSSDGNDSCSIVATGIYANTTTLDIQSDTASHCTITTTTETGTVSSTIACSSVTLTREGLELLSTALVNNTCTSTLSASTREPISVSTLCSLSSLVTTDRSSTAIHSASTSNCIIISSTSSGSVSNSVGVCYVQSTEDVVSAAHHVQTTGLSIHRMLAVMP